VVTAAPCPALARYTWRESNAVRLDDLIDAIQKVHSGVLEQLSDAVLAADHLGSEPEGFAVQLLIAQGVSADAVRGRRRRRCRQQRMFPS
jgi:hypothetical protein